MKLYDRPRTQETLDRLPELPEDVKIPDDTSGLQPPTTLKPTTGGIRWMRWLAAIVVLGVVGVMAALIFSGGTTEIDQADVYGSDRHLTTGEDLATNPAIDYMALYGTDNPVFVREAAQDTGPYLELYGTDNPVFVPEAAQDTGLYLELYGTDNPVFVQEVVDTMEMYGTDNPVFVETVPEVVPPMFGPHEGPGSNSLAATTPETTPMFGPHEGPGSNSLAP